MAAPQPRAKPLKVAKSKAGKPAPHKGRDSVVRARIESQYKQEAAAVLAEIGLTISDAIRLMLIRTARDKEIPFQPLIPNAETIAAMEDAIAGRNMKRFDTVEELMADLFDDESD